MVKWFASFHHVKYGKTQHNLTLITTQAEAIHDTGGC